MGFLRQILLILFLTILSLAGLIVLGTIFPDVFASGSGEFLLYVVGASLIFLFFLKRYREGRSSGRGQEPPPDETTETAAERSSDKRLEEMRVRIRDRKKSKE
jgi:hypothetical protein